MNVIEINNLNVYYGENKVLKNINTVFTKNKIHSIIGPPKSGKTTLLHSLNRLVEIDSGSIIGNILYYGENVLDIDTEKLRKNIGIVFQKPIPFPLSVYENLAYPLRYYGIKEKSEIDNIIETNLIKVGLFSEVKDKLNLSPHNLSREQQQRLCIARSLMVNPKILLLDEPCSSLDIKGTFRIEEILNNLSEEITVILVTHDLEQAKRVSERTLFFKSGKLIEDNYTKEIFINPKEKFTENYLINNRNAIFQV